MTNIVIPNKEHRLEKTYRQWIKFALDLRDGIPVETIANSYKSPYTKDGKKVKYNKGSVYNAILRLDEERLKGNPIVLKLLDEMWIGEE